MLKRGTYKPSENVFKVIKVKAEAGQKSVKGERGLIKREIQPKPN